MSVPSQNVFGTARGPPAPATCILRASSTMRYKPQVHAAPASAAPPAPAPGERIPGTGRGDVVRSERTEATPRRQIRHRRRPPRRTACGCNTIRLPRSRSGLSGSAEYRHVFGHPAPPSRFQRSTRCAGGVAEEVTIHPTANSVHRIFFHISWNWRSNIGI